MTEEIHRIMRRMGDPVDISSDNGMNEMRREEILLDLTAQMTHFAVQDTFVLIRTNNGRCLMEKRTVHDSPMVGFMYQTHNSGESVSFWYNASSVQNIGAHLRGHMDKRVSMERLTQE